MNVLIEDTIEHGALGSLREIRDGELSLKEDYGGATSQAWSLAELLRVQFESVLGIKPLLLDRLVLWDPASVGLHARVFLGGQEWSVSLEEEKPSNIVHVYNGWKYVGGTWPDGINGWEVQSPNRSPETLTEQGLPYRESGEVW